MCGISGIYSESVPKRYAVEKSISRIRHRGPDSTGFYESEICSLGMCRLSIQDVLHGHQPNYSKNRRIVSVFNGEIYNHSELRSELERKGYEFNSSGDACLIPHLYEEYGERFAEKLEGMFAISIFDEKEEKLILTRDRAGEKPLWYSLQENSLYFSSELKGLLALGVKGDFDSSLLSEYLTFGYINSPRSPFKNVYQIPPATTLIFTRGQIRMFPYWDPRSVGQLEIEYEEAKEEAQRLLIQSVQGRLLSERPLGVFLSGGVDSSLVAAIANEVSADSIKSFSLGFLDRRFDESKFARLVAEDIGTEHHEVILKGDISSLVLEVSGFLDQPFADSSVIPTFALSKFARNNVVVALSGDGGDEIFGGYTRYHATLAFNKLNPLLFLFPQKMLSTKKISSQRAKKALSNFKTMSFGNRYKSIQSLFQEKDIKSFVQADLLSTQKLDSFQEFWNSASSTDNFRKMQNCDLRSYLPGDLLYKVDQASMAASLEVRSPFLDYRVMEFGLSLPRHFKGNLRRNKPVLRDLANSLIDSSLIDRPKKGFSIPQDDWIRGEVSSLVKSVLLNETCNARGWFNIREIEKLIRLHDEGHQLGFLIWPLLMLELWALNWID